MKQKPVTLICKKKIKDGSNLFIVSGEFDSREKAFAWAAKFKNRMYRPTNECGETWYLLPPIFEWERLLDYEF